MQPLLVVAVINTIYGRFFMISYDIDEQAVGAGIKIIKSGIPYQFSIAAGMAGITDNRQISRLPQFCEKFWPGSVPHSFCSLIYATFTDRYFWNFSCTGTFFSELFLSPI